MILLEGCAESGFGFIAKRPGMTEIASSKSVSLSLNRVRQRVDIPRAMLH